MPHDDPALDTDPGFELPEEILRPDDRVHLRAFGEIRETQQDGETLLVTGVAYPALVVADGAVAKGDLFRIDSYRTWMAPKTLQRFAHTFLERGTGGIDSQHDHENVGCIVESWYQTEAREGTPADVWMVKVRVLRADTIAAIRDGKITGYSIEFTGRYRKVALRLEGGSSMQTAEILTPYPLTLSLVERPATGIALSAVEARSEAPTSRAGESVLVRFAPPTNDPAAARAASAGDVMPNDDDQTTTTTTTPAPTTTEPAAQTTPETQVPAATQATDSGDTTTREAPVVTTPASTEPATSAEGTPAAVSSTPETQTPATTTVDEKRQREIERAAKLEAMRAAVRSAVIETFGDVATGKRASVDWTSLASIIAEYKDFWTIADATKHALYCGESVLYEILYSCSPEELGAKMRTLGSDLAQAFADAADEYEASLSTRSTRSAPENVEAAQRAGKKISKATREKLSKAQQCARDCDGHLAELLKEGEEGEVEEQEDSQANSARAAAAARIAELEGQLSEARAAAAARIAELEGQLSEARAAVAAESARAKVLATDLATERSARETAEKRAQALASARPAARGDTEPVIPAARTEQPPKATTDTDRPFAGLLGLSRFVSRAPQGDAGSEE